MLRELTQEQKDTLDPDNIEIVGQVLQTLMELCDGRSITIDIVPGVGQPNCFEVATTRNGIEPRPDLQGVINEFVWLAQRGHV